MGSSQSSTSRQDSKDFDYGFVPIFKGRFSQRYEIIKQLGSGAEGAAYLVQRKEDKKRRASALTSFMTDGPPKWQYVAKQTHNMTPGGREIFLEEFEKWKQLEHPHCIKVIELVDGKDYVDGQLKDQIVVISELAKGGDLFHYMREMVESGCAIDEKWIAEVFRQAMQGVAYMHAKNVVHNDLKPDNILVMDQFEKALPGEEEPVPTVKVSDFGCATLNQDTDFSWGDPRYQSPETWKYIVQVLEKKRNPQHIYKMSPKADVWSLGVTLFELLSGGKIPFLYEHASLNDILDHKDQWNKLRRGIESEEIQIEEHCGNRKVSEEVKDLLRQMFRKDPSERPSVSELLKHPWFSIAPRKLEGDFSTLDLNCLKGKAHSVLLNALVAKLRNEQATACWEAFQRADEDHSGSINREEFLMAMKELGNENEEEAAAAFKAADVDGDGKLVYREFVAINLSKVEQDAKDVGLKRLFLQIDANRSGEVSETELVAALSGAVDLEEVKKVFTIMDDDSDGKVSLKEFQSFLLEPCTSESVSSFTNARHSLAQRRSSCAGAAPARVCGCLDGLQASWKAYWKARERQRLRARRSVAKTGWDDFDL